jgi:hypothetical protein
MTQQEIADLLDVARSYVSMIKTETYLNVKVDTSECLSETSPALTDKERRVEAAYAANPGRTTTAGRRPGRAGHLRRPAGVVESPSDRTPVPPVATADRGGRAAVDVSSRSSGHGDVHAEWKPLSRWEGFGGRDDHGGIDPDQRAGRTH